MSKRAIDAAITAYPDNRFVSDEYADMCRSFYQEGYKQAEKDTIKRVVEWLKVHAEDYIVNMTGSYPDAPFNAIIGGKCWDELKKAMKKNNG